MSRSLDFETAEAGTPIDGISIAALTRVTLAKFAGATDDYNALHLDDKVAQASGKNSVYAKWILPTYMEARIVKLSLKAEAQKIERS